jgi:hypothetical protein
MLVFFEKNIDISQHIVFRYNSIEMQIDMKIKQLLKILIKIWNH